MIRVKILDNECLEGIVNDFVNSTENLSELQKQLSADEEYMKLSATADGIKEALAGCPEADLMEAFEDAVFWKSGYEANIAYLEGIRKGFNLYRFIMDGIEETGRRQQARAEVMP